MNKVRSLAAMVNETHPSPAIIDYMIRNSHRYLLLINCERDARILLSYDNYASITEDNHVYYIHTKEPVLINGQTLINTFEIDIDDGDDIIGFDSVEAVIKYCDKHKINTSQKITSKLIFSPQLANYLLDEGFHIIHLKPHNQTGETIYVFAVENGFYQAIERYRKGI